MAKQWFSHKTKTCSKLKNLPFSLKSFDVSGQFHIKINVQISIFDTLKSTYIHITRMMSTHVFPITGTGGVHLEKKRERMF